MPKIYSLFSCVRRRPVEQFSTWLLFCCLCFTAIVVSIVSFVLSTTSSRSTAQLLFALIATSATTAVHKFTVLEFSIILLHRRRSHCAIVLDAIFSNWTEAALAIAAVLRGQTILTKAFLVGSVSINSLLLLGISFIHGGHRNCRNAYEMLMAPIHARMLPVGSALLISSAIFTTKLGGTYLHSSAPTAN